WNGLFQSGDDRGYKLGFMAVDFLIPPSQSRSAGVQTLVAFWNGIGQGKIWQTSFRDTFGRAISDFYAQFEIYRQTFSSSSINITGVNLLGQPIAGRQFYIEVNGSGFDPNSVRVVLVGPGCSNYGDCSVPNNILNQQGSVTSSQIQHVPLTLAAAG